MQARPFVVRPQHWHLFDAQTRAAREEEHFGIECPALDFLLRENTHRGVPTKGLESALRIGKVQAEHDPQHQIKNSPENLAIERLPLGLQFRVKPARADGYIRASTDRVKQFLRFSDWGRKIGVGKEANFTTRMQHSVAHAVTFAPVAGIFD
jgi:hypothetical protein